MEFLKEIFGGGATYEQLAAKVAEKKMKLADLPQAAMWARKSSRP